MYDYTKESRRRGNVRQVFDWPSSTCLSVSDVRLFSLIKALELVRLFDFPGSGALRLEHFCNGTTSGGHLLRYLGDIRGLERRCFFFCL